MSISAREAVRTAGLEQHEFELEGVRIVPMPRLVAALIGRRVTAITVWNAIVVRRDFYAAIVEGTAPTLLIHELMHVAQWHRDGVVGFLSRYVSEYARLRWIGVGHDVAYRGISFEHAAFDAADRYEQRAA